MFDSFVPVLGRGPDRCGPGRGKVGVVPRGGGAGGWPGSASTISARAL